jgi:hypothetical protein
MFRLVNAVAKPLTIELAEQFRDMKPSPTERDLDPKRVQRLREKLLAGHSITYQWSTAKLGHEVFRMNGNHSSNMLSALNGQFLRGCLHTSTNMRSTGSTIWRICFVSSMIVSRGAPQTMWLAPIRG